MKPIHGHYVGDEPTPTYNSWQAMKKRCYDEKHQKFSRYGGRGIIVCDRWIDSFENFLEDMGVRPEDKTLDRKNLDGNYTPDNCIWSDMKTQCRNRSTTKLTVDEVKRIKILLRNKTYLQKEIAYMFGVTSQCICDIKKGRNWSDVTI